MRVFISWSGTRSQRVANYLSEWLPQVIQSCQPFFSTKDIDPGSIWFKDITDQLAGTKVGILCITKENHKRPWILFEAGALMKGLDTARVCPILIDMELRDIEPPLSNFNLVKIDEPSIRSVLKTINDQLPSKLPETLLDRAFERCWPDLNNAIIKIIQETESNSPKPVKRSQDEILDEMLITLRNLEKRLGGSVAGPVIGYVGGSSRNPLNYPTTYGPDKLAERIRQHAKFIYHESHVFPTLEECWNAYKDEVNGIDMARFKEIYDDVILVLSIARDQGLLTKREVPYPRKS